LRTYILTKYERKIIQRFLETGDKLEGFKVLLHRLRKQFDPKQVKGDLELIEQYLKKAAE